MVVEVFVGNIFGAARFCVRDCSVNPFCTLRKKIGTKSPLERPNICELVTVKIDLKFQLYQIFKKV